MEDDNKFSEKLNLARDVTSKAGIVVEEIQSHALTENTSSESSISKITDLFSMLYELDEYLFMEFIEDCCDNEENLLINNKISAEVLSHLETDPNFVGTYFACLSGVDAIDPVDMQKVSDIDVYPFSGDGDDFNRTKCPASSVALSPSAPEELLGKLAASDDFGIRYRVALNSNTTEKILIDLISFVLAQPDDEWSFMEEYVLATIAFHVNATPKVLTALEGSPFESTGEVMKLRNENSWPLCREFNADCEILSSTIGDALLWWDITSMSWAIKGLACKQGQSCSLGISV